MKRFLLTAILSTLCLWRVSAQENGWTLDECMRYAVENSPVTAEQMAQYQINKQNYRSAVAGLMPSLQARSDAFFYYGRSLSEDNTYRDENTFNNNYGIYASITVFDGLSSINRVKMEKVNRAAGKHQLDATRDNLAYRTMEAFFNVQYYTGTAALAREQLEESSRNLHQTERMAELGVKGFPDVAEMKAQQAADRYNLTKQENMLTLAVIALKEVMNLPIDRDIEIEPYSTGLPPEKSAGTAVSIYNGSLAELPRALTAEAELESSRLAYRMAKGGIYPTLSLDAGVSTNFFKPDRGDYSPFKDQFKDKRSEYFGFTLSVPIFNGLSRSSEKARGRYRLDIAKSRYEQTMRTLYGEIEQAVADMNGQAEECRQADAQAEAVEVAHNVNRRKYEEGLVSALELHTSANRLMSARIEQQYSLLKYYLKNKLVKYYSGEPFIAHAE